MRKQLILFAVLVVVVVFSAAQEIRKAQASYSSPVSGKEMYMDYCASCHGADAKGNGPATPALKTAPTDLTRLTVRNGGEFPELHVYAVIKGDEMMPAHGSVDMPVWGSVFRELDQHDASDVHMRLTNLTHYLESVQER